MKLVMLLHGSHRGGCRQCDELLAVHAGLCLERCAGQAWSIPACMPVPATAVQRHSQLQVTTVTLGGMKHPSLHASDGLWYAGRLQLQTAAVTQGGTAA